MNECYDSMTMNDLEGSQVEQNSKSFITLLVAFMPLLLVAACY